MTNKKEKVELTELQKKAINNATAVAFDTAQQAAILKIMEVVLNPHLHQEQQVHGGDQVDREAEAQKRFDEQVKQSQREYEAMQVEPELRVLNAHIPLDTKGEVAPAPEDDAPKAKAQAKKAK